MPSFRCSSLSSFPWAWMNKCGLAWNPWGNSVQVYYCIWLKWGLVHSKANRYWDRKEGTLEVTVDYSASPIQYYKNWPQGECIDTTALFTALRSCTIQYSSFGSATGRIAVFQETDRALRDHVLRIYLWGVANLFLLPTLWDSVSC